MARRRSSTDGWVASKRELLLVCDCRPARCRLSETTDRCGEGRTSAGGDAFASFVADVQSSRVIVPIVAVVDSVCLSLSETYLPTIQADRCYKAGEGKDEKWIRKHSTAPKEKKEFKVSDDVAGGVGGDLSGAHGNSNDDDEDFVRTIGEGLGEAGRGECQVK